MKGLWKLYKKIVAILNADKKPDGVPESFYHRDKR